MKSVLVSVVRNEEDIVEMFVRYHLQIFDHISIISHQSKDDTNKILKCLQEEGLSLDVDYCTDFYHNQGEVVTAKAKEVRNKYKPQVIMALDADEFVVGNIKKAAHEIKESGTTLGLCWHNYIVTEKDDLHEINPLKRIVHRNVFVNKEQTKQLVPGILFDYDTKYWEGCHHLHKLDGSYVKFVLSQELKLAHFPIRSAKQFVKKALVGWLSKLANPDNKGNAPDWSHWKLFFDKVKKGYIPTIDELQNFCLGYTERSDKQFIYDPVFCDNIEIKYPACGNYESLEALADVAELFALKLYK